MKEFLPELAFPVYAILKEAVATHTWPEEFNKEYHLPLKKIPNPESEDDVRGIGLTGWVSKQLERLVLNWIWPYLQPHIDPDQLGGMPGCSIEHYIIEMTHFILSSMDGNPDAAVLAVPVDYSKAFNRMLHSDILCNLSALSVPNCATKLIKSYLTGRTMCTRYKGAESTFHRMPGGGPQGGILTSLLFMLQVNKAVSLCHSPVSPALGQNSNMQPVQGPALGPYPARGQNRNIQPVSDPAPELQPSHPTRRQEAGTLPACHNQSNLNKNAFIDDLTLLEKISLSKLIHKERIIHRSA